MSIPITITSDEYDGKLGIDSEGTCELRFKVTGISKHDDEMLGDESKIYYNLDCELLNVSIDKMNLEQAAERAASPIPVKNSVNPAP